MMKNITTSIVCQTVRHRKKEAFGILFAEHHLSKNSASKIQHTKNVLMNHIILGIALNTLQFYLSSLSLHTRYSFQYISITMKMRIDFGKRLK